MNSTNTATPETTFTPLSPPPLRGSAAAEHLRDGIPRGWARRHRLRRMSAEESAEQDMAAALARLPKVELHCHVEGTMHPATVAELAARNGLALPTADPTELYHYVSLNDFLRIFWLVQSTLGGRDDWARLAYESVLDAAAAGVVYRETFFTPARHLEAGRTSRTSWPGWPTGWPPARPRPARGSCSSATWTARTAAAPPASWSTGWSSCAAEARPAPTECSASGWTRPSSASTRATTPRRTGRRPRPGCAGPPTRARTTRRR